MTDWRTSQAFPERRSRLPEDDLPEIDWGGALFTQGGGDEPEPEPMPDPGEEERAMARLRARIAERDAAEGLMDPWAQEQAGPLPGPQSPPLMAGQPAPLRAPRDGRTMAGAGLSMGMPEMTPLAPPAAPMTPQQSAQAAFRQPALDAVRAGVGAVTPPPDPMAPPPQPTAPDAVPTATTDPNAPTVTAGSQAAGLAQRPAAPQSSTMAPTGAPQFAMGATGLGGPQAGMSDRVAAGAPDGNVFGRQLDAARDEDVRRQRWRAALKGIGAMLALRSGNAGFMVPAAIGAGLVRRPDEEATLRANDERAQAVGGAQAEQRALLEQLAMRREAQQATERQGQQTLALRAQELAASDADRATRTGLEVARTGLEVARTDPSSGRSGQMREALVRFARTLPPEVQQSVLSGDLSGLSAEESERLILSLSNIEGERQRGGGRGGGAGSGEGAGLPAGRRQGLEEVPDAYVNMIRSRIGADQDAQASAQVLWGRMSPEEQADWLGSEAADHWRSRTIGQYRQTRPGMLTPEMENAATTAAAGEAEFAVLEQRALAAAQGVEEMPDVAEAGTRLVGAAGVNLTDDMSEFDDVRVAMISALNQMGGGGTLDATEFARWDSRLPSLSSLRSMAPGAATRALRVAFDRAKEVARARMRARGFERVDGGGTAPTTTADAPPAPEREHPIVFRVRLPDGRVQQIRTTPSRAEADQARARERGWTVVQ